MKPVRLRVEGLTAYRSPIDVSFEGLDLFAIWGPTGAGKTSLVDAITYALFGRIPRVGRNIKDLIAQGEERLKVEFEFSADGARYRVHRSTGHKGAARVQVERYDPATGQWHPEEDRASEAEKHIERLLGMDYEGFVRSVLLPQGQFQQFLAGPPEEKRKVLDTLLRLDIYQQMLQRANNMAADSTRTADGLAHLLETEYADATDENLRAAKEKITELTQQAEALQEQAKAVDALLEKAKALASARERARGAESAIAGIAEELREAKRLLEDGEKEIQRVREQLDEVKKRLTENRYDPDLAVRLSKASGIAQAAEKARGNIRALEEAARENEEAVVKAQKAAEEAKAALALADEALADAETRLQEVRRAEAAAAVRQGLKPGDICPVCGQKIVTLPPQEHPAVEEAQRRLDEAKREREAAEAAAKDASQTLSTMETLRQTYGKQLDERRKELAEQEESLRTLLGGEPATVGEIERAAREQETHLQEKRQLENDREQLQGALDDLQTGLAGARESVAKLQAEREQREKERNSALSEAETLASEVAAEAARRGWDDVRADLEGGGAAVAPLEARRGTVLDLLNRTNQDLGSARETVQRLEKAVEKAKQLREQEAQERRAARLARDLANLLQTNRFPDFIRQQALRTLAEDGSRELMKMTRNRYELRVEDGDFVVVDHWNGDERRPVKTLSGGETFIASLALAVALAEHLPSLAAGARSTPLDCLLIDEGFSHLDAESLDEVATALEEIGAGGNRMVGVITHLSALAERMPARVVVHKAPSGSTVTVE